MPRVLELFSGTASIGRAFRAAGWEVTSLDLESKFQPDICCDILLWDFRAAFSPGYFQFIWASPVCTEYSRALTTRPRRLLEGDALVLRTIEVIAYFEPVMWAIENPATGLLKTRSFMEHLPWLDVTYCQYGTPYRKQTRLWTNMLWRPSSPSGHAASMRSSARRSVAASTWLRAEMPNTMRSQRALQSVLCKDPEADWPPFPLHSPEADWPSCSPQKTDDEQTQLQS